MNSPPASGATVHTVVGDDVSAALLEFARETNATQLVLGTSRRSRWASIFSEGIGAATIKNSGKIDVHMVTHDQANRGFSFASISPRARRSFVARRVTVPWIMLAITCAAGSDCWTSAARRASSSSA